MRRRWLLAAPALAAVAPHGGMSATPSSLYLTPDSNLGDVLHHPAFAGFAPLLLPWDGRAYDEALPLRDIGTLLPYHSAVRPAVVVAAINRMIDATAAGRAVFHRFYDDAAIRLDASKANTGLFFFRGRPGAPFAIICPGGGFAYVGSLHEGFPYAVEISAAGLNAFVLRYRAGMGGAIATEDLAAALAYVQRQAGTFDIGPKISRSGEARLGRAWPPPSARATGPAWPRWSWPTRHLLRMAESNRRSLRSWVRRMGSRRPRAWRAGLPRCVAKASPPSFA